MENLNTIAEQIAGLNPTDAGTLLEIFKNDYGIEPISGGVTVVMNVESEEVEAKSEFDVILEAAGTSKLAIVKMVKDLTSLGLREAKALVDGCPSTLREAITENEAKALKDQLENAGATVTLK